MQRLERKLDINTIMDILNGNQCYPEDLFDIPSISSSPEQQKELELFTCPICTGIFNRATIDNCNPPHTFGNRCIMDCLKQKMECPFSRSPLHNADLRKIPLIFQYFMDKIMMKCLFYMYGCKWIGKIGDIKTHMKDCPMGFLLKTEISVNDISELDKMPRERMEKISVHQIDVDMFNFPLKAPKELDILGFFSNLKELFLDFKFHTFNNHHNEFLILNNALNSLPKLEKLSLILINRYVECINESNFMYWFDIENHETEIMDIVKWNGLKTDGLDIIFNKTFERCRDIKTINLNLSYNGLTADGLSKLMENVRKLQGVEEVFFDFSNQQEVEIKKGEKLHRKKLNKCFKKINLEKNIGFFSFFTKKTLRNVATSLFGEKLKNLVY